MHRGLDLSPDAYEAAFAAFERAVRAANGQKPFAGIVGCTQGAISQRLIKRSLLAAEHVLKAEASTGVSRHELRPDLYPLGLQEGAPFLPVERSLGHGAPIVACGRSANLQATVEDAA